MKEYSRILAFYYDGKIYNYYLDSNNKKFFLELNVDGSESYVTIEKYIELLNIFSKRNEVMSLVTYNTSNNEKTHAINSMLDSKKKYKRKKKKRILPKVLVGGVATFLTPVLVLSAISSYNVAHKDYSASYNKGIEQSSTTYDEETLEEDTGLNEKLEVDTYIDNRDLTKRLYIYDADYVDMAIDFEKKDLNDFIDVINNNSKIPKKFKTIAIQYCKDVFSKYPNIELRPFYQNLQNLEVVECTDDELLQKTWSIDSVGCFVKSEDKIYVLKGKEYEYGTWDYQVIYHELSHCLRDSQFTDKNGNEVRIQFDGLNYWDVPNSEAINSLFAVSLFDYEETDIAYQFQSNAHKLMIECMDNYDLSDYVNHSFTYYAKKLDEYNNDDNYATTILSLMNAQYEDYHDDKIKAPQSEYYPIYDYISEMYLGKHVNSNMSYDEALDIMNTFLDKLLFDVPEEYNVDKNHFYEYFNDYCESIGISVQQNTK